VLGGDMEDECGGSLIKIETKSNIGKILQSIE
jgi:hypothetical protein